MSATRSPMIRRAGDRAGSMLSWRRWVPWGIGGLLSVGVVFAFADASRGVGSDPRLRRVPAGPQTLHPLFGVHDWPLIFSLLFIVVAVAILGVFGYLSWRDRSAHRAFIVILAVTLLSLLDPPANWVTYTSFDPNFLHFDPNWFWVKLAPTVEPLPNVPGYPMYFGMVGLCSAWVARKYLASARGQRGWSEQHPLATAFVIGFVIAILWDIPTELFMVRAGMYFYAESWGPRINWGPVHWPIVWGFFTWLPIACTTLMLLPDDTGRSRVLATMSRRVAARRGSGRRVSAWREVWLGFLVLAAAYTLCLGIYGALRVTGADKPTGQPWPYPQMKVYDPYHHWQQAGLPGPYYQ